MHENKHDKIHSSETNLVSLQSLRNLERMKLNDTLMVISDFVNKSSEMSMNVTLGNLSDYSGLPSSFKTDIISDDFTREFILNSLRSFINFLELPSIIDSWGNNHDARRAYKFEIPLGEDGNITVDSRHYALDSKEKAGKMSIIVESGDYLGQILEDYVAGIGPVSREVMRLINAIKKESDLMPDVSKYSDYDNPMSEEKKSEVVGKVVASAVRLLNEVHDLLEELAMVKREGPFSKDSTVSM